MLDRMRPRRGSPAWASAGRVTAAGRVIAVVVVLVAFAFGSYLHSALRTGVRRGRGSAAAVAAACSIAATAR